MFKYRSKCRWNMLLHVDGDLVEIRPGEEFSSAQKFDSRYLEEIKKQVKKTTKAKESAPEEKNIDVSSTQS